MTENSIVNANERLKHYESKKREFSEKASVTSRGLAYAQIALFWMCLNQFEYKGAYVYVGLSTLILFLFFDVMQYLFGLFSYKLLCSKTRKNIKQGKCSQQYINNKGANILPNAFFWVKVVLLIFSSILLGISFYKAILIKFF